MTKFIENSVQLWLSSEYDDVKLEVRNFTKSQILKYLYTLVNTRNVVTIELLLYSEEEDTTISKIFFSMNVEFICKIINNKFILGLRIVRVNKPTIKFILESPIKINVSKDIKQCLLE